MDKEDNLIKFPDIMSEINAIRIKLAMDSMGAPEDEYAAINQIIVGMHRFLNTLEGSEYIILQLGYLDYLLAEFYERN